MDYLLTKTTTTHTWSVKLMNQTIKVTPKGQYTATMKSPVLLQTESMEKVGDPLDKLLESEKLLDSLNASRWTPLDRGRDSVL